MNLSVKPLLIIFILSLVFIGLITLDYQGIIWHNNLFAYFYSVKGLDVSSYQGDVDWKIVADSKKYSFVYIKATEGHDYTDDYFLKNWNEAKKNGFLVGAYHFFSLRSSGKDQAELFISIVPYDPQALPPVIDVEVDTKKDPNQVRNELQKLSDELFQHYKKTPILYVTDETYKAYVKGYFDQNPLWIRDVIKPPSVSNWNIWQYNNRGRVRGVDSYVDINVFNGNHQELEELAN